MPNDPCLCFNATYIYHICIYIYNYSYSETRVITSLKFHRNYLFEIRGKLIEPGCNWKLKKSKNRGGQYRGVVKAKRNGKCEDFEKRRGKRRKRGGNRSMTSILGSNGLRPHTFTRKMAVYREFSPLPHKSKRKFNQASEKVREGKL